MTSTVASVPLFVVVLLIAIAIALSAPPSEVHGEERTIGQRISTFFEPIKKLGIRLFPKVFGKNEPPTRTTSQPPAPPTHSQAQAMLPSRHRIPIDCGDWDEEATMYAPWQMVIIPIADGHVMHEARTNLVLHQTLSTFKSHNQHFLYGTLIGPKLLLTNNNNRILEEDPEATGYTFFIFLPNTVIQQSEEGPLLQHWEVEEHVVNPRSPELHWSIKQVVLMILKEAVNFSANPTIRPLCLPETMPPIDYVKVLWVPFEMTDGEDENNQLSHLDYVDGKRKVIDAGVPRLIKEELQRELGYLDISGPAGRTYKIASGSAATHKGATNRHVLVGIVDEFSFEVSTRGYTEDPRQKRHVHSYYFLDATFPQVRAWITENKGRNYIYSE